MIRRNVRWWLLASVLGFGAAAADEARVLAEVDASREDMVTWRRALHAAPELGNREVNTAARVAAHLRALGLEVEEQVALTGVVALLTGGKPGPRVALRADMDALPVTEQADVPFKSTVTSTFRGETVGVMHACGHDAHVAILMGVAQALARHRAEMPGSVLFIFQPAEEGPPEGEEGGAELMLKEGLFDRYRPQAVLGLHVWSALPVGTVGMRAGPIMAESDRFRIVVRGRQTHGAKPWAGTDPIVSAAHIVVALQSVVSRNLDLTRAPAVVSVGAIKGGIRYNIIPDQVEMIGTIRTFEDATRERVFADIERIAANTAQAHGTTAQTELWRHTHVSRNDDALAARLRPALVRALGEEQVIAMNPLTIAEDFALFAERVPGFYFFVGATPVGQDPEAAPANHSPLFYLDEGALTVGARALLATTWEYLNNHS
jgi:amidohydrolase